MLPSVTNFWFTFVCATQREETNPLGDACVRCPPGDYNLDGSAWNEQKPQSGIGPPPDGFCQPCPRAGASCPGGSTVYAMEGWYTFEIEMRSARRTISTETTIETYECPLEACAGNNTCKGGRTGLLCGYCPAGTALELNACVECERDAAATSILQIVVGILALCVLFLILFLAGWRHVFPDNRVHGFFDKVQGMMFSLLERVASCVRKKGRNVKVDPATARRAFQAAKIFFSYYQVVSGFIRFQVQLPDILQSTLRYLKTIGNRPRRLRVPRPGLSRCDAVGPNAGH